MHQDESDYSGSQEAEDVLKWALDTFHPHIALAASFQHNVLIHMAVNIRPDVRVFAIDTGRLPEETYKCAAELQERFGLKIEWYLPRNDAIEKLLNEQGLFSFRRSVGARRECCAVRKVEPLSRALTGLRAWITGLRREQNISRRDVRPVQRDDQHGGILKICPLAEWSMDRVRDYAAAHQLPCNPLCRRGFTSVGCACCTRAVEPGEHPRAGRWWWEEPEHKECGLHVPNWTI